MSTEPSGCINKKDIGFSRMIWLKPISLCPGYLQLKLEAMEKTRITSDAKTPYQA
jgi:hypothetical protein